MTTTTLLILFKGMRRWSPPFPIQEIRIKVSGGLGVVLGALGMASGRCLGMSGEVLRRFCDDLGAVWMHLGYAFIFH